MIIVKNTRELEEKYNLDLIPDSESIRVTGGTEGKSKYDEEKYKRRTTYSARQLKQIIGQMREIEEKIPSDWNAWQRAKYIYTQIASQVAYNYDRSTYGNQQSSNLSILMTGKGICAGYSLAFKEMMDRQGIKCDYIRGIGYSRRKERHAWNILTIDGTSFPVDLTWDSGLIQKGNMGELQYFGNNLDFKGEHEPDSDERQYDLKRLTEEQIKRIDISKTKKNKDIVKNLQRQVIRLAIEKTYKKFTSKYGDKIGRNQVNGAIMQYIKTGKADLFTRDGMARDKLTNNVSPNDLLNILTEDFVKQSLKKARGESVLENSVCDTATRYFPAQAEDALRKYISSDSLTGFTRQNGARENLFNTMSSSEAFKSVIENFTSREIENLVTVMQNPKNYFYVDELSAVKAPEQKTLENAIHWIGNRDKQQLPENNVYNAVIDNRGQDIDQR